ncbi:MAG TPA: c-type cytochrome [Candidatus Kapabacteria bacterium]|nr:c-type cytochrome [Candidatus Kapabacteria bacterium]
MKNKLFISAFCLLSLISVATVASISQDKEEEDEKPVNLKVLPSDLTADQIDHIMHAFSESLGVKCGYCHAPKKSGEKGLDFASDENPKKDVARFMIKMTNEINDEYFKEHTNEAGNLLQIGCNTCHNGSAKPSMREIKK